MSLIHPDLSYAIIGAAMEVHQHFRNGYLETVYEAALARELELQGFDVRRQVPLTITYKGADVGHYIVDLLINDRIIVELKAVKTLNQQHFAQTLNYLATTGRDLALLINFGSRSLQHKRIVRTKNQ